MRILATTIRVHGVFAAVLLYGVSLVGWSACRSDSPPAAERIGGGGSSLATKGTDGGAPDSTADAARPGSADPGAVRTLTGARTRVVWVQSSENDPTASGRLLVLMGLDSDDGRGERVILGHRGSYIKPLLLARGERIVYTARDRIPSDLRTFIVNWDGSDRRQLTAGAALAVWEDPKDGRDWVYVGMDNTPEAPGDFRTVIRFPVDRPQFREIVWNKTPVSGDTFQVSADGRVAGGLFPWPQAGIVGLPNGELRTFGEGCWTAFRHVGPGLLWYLDGAHRNITMVDVEAKRRWSVPLNRVPGFKDPEIYHPRWANHPRFLAMSGPYTQGGANQVRSGGAQTEIYLGRFSQDYSRVEAWARATENGAGDSYPDLWVDRPSSPYPAELRSSGQQPAQAPAPSNTRLVVEARLASVTGIPPPRSIAPYRNALIVNVYDVVRVVEGTYRDSQVLVAQWGIRDRRVLPEMRERTVGATSRLTLERYDVHPELEGERLIARSDVPDLPLYFDVGAIR